MVNLLNKKTILIIHFRVGRTDGVSLEIGSWKKILQKDGYKVLTCGGSQSIGADFVIPDLEQQLNPKMFNLDEEAFGGFKRFKGEEEFKQKYEKVKDILYKGFIKVFEEAKPDTLIVSNIFSVGEGLPAAEALTLAITEKQIKTIAVCHDFYWESARYKLPSIPFVKSKLRSFFPPKSNLFKYFCINSLAVRELRRRKGIDAGILHDTLDFSLTKEEKSSKVKELFEENGIDKNDIVVLQGTRIVRRKNIELAIDFVRELKVKLESRGVSVLYDGKVYDPTKNKIVLVLAGYAEKRDFWYLKKLREYAKELGVILIHINNVTTWLETGKHDGYSLLDFYDWVDLITYPSEREGFGNQFLEAVYGRKPVVVFEYPVFRSDIKPKGFEFVSLGSRLRNVNYESKDFVKVGRTRIEKAVKKAIDLLVNKEMYVGVVNKNFEIAKENFSYLNCSKLFQEVLKGEN